MARTFKIFLLPVVLIMIGLWIFASRNAEAVLGEVEDIDVGDITIVFSPSRVETPVTVATNLRVVAQGPIPTTKHHPTATLPAGKESHGEPRHFTVIEGSRWVFTFVSARFRESETTGSWTNASSGTHFDTDFTDPMSVSGTPIIHVEEWGSEGEVTFSFTPKVVGYWNIRVKAQLIYNEMCEEHNVVLWEHISGEKTSSDTDIPLRSLPIYYLAAELDGVDMEEDPNEDDEEIKLTVGAVIMLNNNDNDLEGGVDLSDTEVKATGGPGSTDERDLKHIAIRSRINSDNIPTTGTIILKRSSGNIRVFTDPRKGDSSPNQFQLLFGGYSAGTEGNGKKTWDLSDNSQREDFIDLFLDPEPGVYVEGAVASGSKRDTEVTITYNDGSSDVCVDTLKITVIDVSMDFVKSRANVEDYLSGSINPEGDVNQIRNPAAIVVEATPSNGNVAFLSVASHGWIDQNDDFILWKIASGGVAFYAPGGTQDNTGKIARVYGTAAGSAAIEVRAKAAAYPYFTYYPSVVALKTIAYRCNFLSFAGVQPSAIPLLLGDPDNAIPAMKKLGLGNIILRQAGIKLVPDTSEANGDMSSGVTTGALISGATTLVVADAEKLFAVGAKLVITGPDGSGGQHTEPLTVTAVTSPSAAPANTVTFAATGVDDELAHNYAAGAAVMWDICPAGTITAALAASGTTLTITDANSLFVIGDTLTIWGGGNSESFTVTGITGNVITVSAGATNAYAIGATVRATRASSNAYSSVTTAAAAQHDTTISITNAGNLFLIGDRLTIAGGTNSETIDVTNIAGSTITFSGGSGSGGLVNGYGAGAFVYSTRGGCRAIKGNLAAGFVNVNAVREVFSAVLNSRSGKANFNFVNTDVEGGVGRGLWGNQLFSCSNTLAGGAPSTLNSQVNENGKEYSVNIYQAPWGADPVGSKDYVGAIIWASLTGAANDTEKSSLLVHEMLHGCGLKHRDPPPTPPDFDGVNLYENLPLLNSLILPNSFTQNLMYHSLPALDLDRIQVRILREAGIVF